ncbi:hypothetical protein CONPUDRAFT_139958 [Coniophora puteana RWD-64-598 SS2]|uniref:Uncharacterized protein n=1 Tax=Coniophora puteana (strain RWD-64-598) TaxID=741705 RepID=A0A5M3M820_CONPW|nr:uncharacterized protein CONPUDRAFT_139958 [Coniophora puteana RWD-64-598 SS2]EIW75422.1 hypothetical protein CONPUDRAFT_139958 [Coniophora puteana RWD-64-598 SS2]
MTRCGEGKWHAESVGAYAVRGLQRDRIWTRVTSNTALLTPHREHRETPRERKSSNHGSLHYNTRLGSRSPSSIPSSPTSAHSSTSAIFERDIEPIGPPSPPNPTHPFNPHRTARSKGTEQLEQSVPSVLDSAAAVLTASSPAEEEQIAVVTPARDTRSGFASPIGSLRSRSPSPTSSRSPSYTINPGPTSRTSSLLLSIPTAPSLSPTAGSPTQPQAPMRPMAGKASPVVGTPTSAYYSMVSEESSPTTTTVEHPPPSELSPPISGLPVVSTPTASPRSLLTAAPAISTASPGASASLSTSPSSGFMAGSPMAGHPLNLSHPPSPSNNASKRLSFMAYSDLLASTPSSLAPLSSFTSGAGAVEAPPHLPSVSGFKQAPAHGTASASASPVGSMRGPPGNRDSVVLLDSLGGEWEREGLGRGLEERLEALMTVPGRA